MPDSRKSNRKPAISLTNELTTHYVISVFVILSCVMGLMFWATIAGVRAQSVRFMKDEISLVQTLLNESSLESLQKKIIVSHENEYAKLYIRIVEKNGGNLVETPAMSRLLPPSVFPPPVSIESPNLYDFHRFKSVAGTFMTAAIWLRILGDPKIVQIGLDVTNIESILPGYLISLALILIVGLLVSTMTGIFIMRKGLRPLYQIADKSRQITAGNLNERFDPERWPAELHDLAGALDGMLDRLETSFERLRNYSANLAHEIRTPIGILMGEAEIALSRHRNVEEYERILESSLDEFKRLSRTIDSLLFLAWADSREVKLNMESVNINDEIRNLHDYYADYAYGRAFMIMCDPDVKVWADATLLRRALSNLIMNAIRYSPEEGIITIRVEKTAWGTLVSIADNGIGIAPEHLEHIFDRFFRVPSSATLHEKGSGLGLSIVKSIMDLHGGTITVDSQLRKGTTFNLTFPVESGIP